MSNINLGSLSELKTDTHEIALIVEHIIPVLKKNVKVPEKIKLISYKMQLVAGVIYFVKVKMEDTYLHLKIYDHLPHENKSPELIAYVENQTELSEIVYF